MHSQMKNKSKQRAMSDDDTEVTTVDRQFRRHGIKERIKSGPERSQQREIAQYQVEEQPQKRLGVAAMLHQMATPASSQFSAVAMPQALAAAPLNAYQYLSPASSFGGPSVGAFQLAMGGGLAQPFGTGGFGQPVQQGVFAATLLGSFSHNLPDQEAAQALMQVVVSMANLAEALLGDALGGRQQAVFKATMQDALPILMQHSIITKDAWDSVLRRHFARVNEECERCGEKGHHAKECHRYFHATEKVNGKLVPLVTGYDPKCGKCKLKLSESKKEPEERGSWQHRSQREQHDSHGPYGSGHHMSLMGVPFPHQNMYQPQAFQPSPAVMHPGFAMPMAPQAAQPMYGQSTPAPSAPPAPRN